MTQIDQSVPAPRAVSAPVAPTPAEVIALQGLRADPAVSVLLTTSPAARMTPQDAARLDQLVRVATARLWADLPARRAEPLAETLRVLALDASSAGTRSAVALYVADGLARGFTLPVSVRNRVVLDPTFATRDLVRALHRTPRYVLLVLTDHSAQLFEGTGDQLHPVHGTRFPIGREAEDTGDRARQRFLRTVDRALGAHLRLRPAPLVLAGVERLLVRFTSLSANTARLAGTVRGSHARARLAELVPLVRPVLDNYLHSRQAEALAHLAARGDASRAVSGVQSVWLAARAERPEMLAVEEGLFYPARLSGDGDYLTPAVDDVEHPDVIDDAVDEIIETVLQRGGWVALIEDGALPDAHERIALTLRR